MSSGSQLTGRLYKQDDLHHEWACWKDFQGHAIKGQGHAATPVEILWTRQLVNRKRWDQNSSEYLLQSGDIPITFSRSWSKVKVICVQVCECYDGGDIHFNGVASRRTCFHRDCV